MKRKWLVLVSLIAHAAVLGGYVIAGMWKIEKVSLDRPPVQLAAMTAVAFDDPTAGLEPGQKPADPEPAKPDSQQVTDDLTQPDVKPDPATTTTTTATPDPMLPPGGGGGTPGTTPTTGTPTPCLDPAGCAQAPKPPRCTGADCLPKKPPFVAPKEVAKQWLSGEQKIVPTEVTKIAMQRAGHDRVTGIVRFCLDDRGRVTSADLQKSTGYPDYDARLAAGVRGWTYRPHTVGATPIPVCSTVRFEFSMK